MKRGGLIQSGKSIQNKQTKNNNQRGDTHIPQPDLRFAIKEKQNSKRGQSPTKTPTPKWFAKGHSGIVPLCHQKHALETN